MYNNYWNPGDRVKYYLEEVCGFCEGMGKITGKNGQTIICPVCNGAHITGPNDYNIDIIEYIVIDNTGVWYHMENGDIVSQGRLVAQVPGEEEEEIIPTEEEESLS